jgi:hypothetical protein
MASIVALVIAVNGIALITGPEGKQGRRLLPISLASCKTGSGGVGGVCIHANWITDFNLSKHIELPSSIWHTSWQICDLGGGCACQSNVFLRFVLME